MNKDILRRLYLEKRKLIPEKETIERNKFLVETFFNEVSLEAIHNLHVYLPIRKQNEPDTILLIDRLRDEHQQINLVISKACSGGSLKHYLYESEEQLRLNKWGIPEPVYGREIAPEQIDMVLVPMVIFDRKGQRIGYGKGYYDRFLAELREDVLKIGYSLSPPLDDLKYSDAFDVKMDACICPLGYLEF